METTEYIEWIRLGGEVLAEILVPALVGAVLYLIKRAADLAGIAIQEDRVEKARARLTEGARGVVLRSFRRHGATSAEDTLVNIAAQELRAYWLTTLPDAVRTLGALDRPRAGRVSDAPLNHRARSIVEDILREERGKPARDPLNVDRSSLDMHQPESERGVDL